MNFKAGLLIGLIFCGGFWGQMIFDMNAWSHLAALPLLVLFVSLCLKQLSNPEENTLTPFALISISVAGGLYLYPEATIFLGFGIFLLILVLIPGIGIEVNGAHRWLRIGPVGFQPSEIMKFITIVYVAGYSVRRLKDLQSHWFAFFKPAVLVVLVVSLILMQPDLGTSAVIFVTVLGMLFVSGVHIRQFILVIGLGFLGILSLIYFVPWRWERIISFMDPWANQYEGGYQLTLSLMAIGRGDWFGVGLGEGLMKLGYLPDAHTDFIFSIVVEEMGLFTAIIIIATLFFLSFRSFYIGRKALQRNLYFGFFISYGVAILIGLHTFINVGVAIGLLPTKGLTLPFISYGGTNLLIMCCLCALVLRVDQETKSSMPAINIPRRVSL